MAQPAYHRVLLKLSGEIFSGPQGSGLDQQRIDHLAKTLTEVQQTGVELAVVVGGGNILRGLVASARGVGRQTADSMGMLATVINGLALEDALQRLGSEACLLSAIPMGEVAETYRLRQARQLLQSGHIVILTGGTGKPYFSTDTAAALRAAELDVDVLLKATKVDGVYTADPLRHPDARFFPCISYQEFINQDLRVMDTAAVVLCMENKIPIVVFNMMKTGNLMRLLKGDDIGSLVKEACS